MIPNKTRMKVINWKSYVRYYKENRTQNILYTETELDLSVDLYDSSNPTSQNTVPAILFYVEHGLQIKMDIQHVDRTTK